MKLQKLPTLTPESKPVPSLPPDRLNNALAMLVRQGWIVKLVYAGNGWSCKIVWPHNDEDAVRFSNATYVENRRHSDATTAFRAALQEQKPKVAAFFEANPDFEKIVQRKRSRRAQGKTALLRLVPEIEKRANQ